MRTLLRVAVVTVFVFSFMLATFVPITETNAEGTHQMNIRQALDAGDTDIYVDILNAGETINISSCEGGTIEIYDTEGTPADKDDDTLVDTDTEFAGNLDCGDPLPNPITNAYEFTPENIGTYRIYLDMYEIYRYDFTVTPNNSTDPDPTVSNGRIWSYKWNFSADGPDFEESTDVDLYALVPAPEEDENFVWKLDLNKFAGNVYSLSANSTGLDAPYAGLSASGDDASVTPEYPIYLGYPEVAGDPNTTTPSITNLTFLDSDEEDDTFSPGGTEGVQDTGTFNFTSNVANATYAITIDTNKDGVYGTGDRVLLGNATLGANSVEWNGTYPNGDPVAEGNYNARIQLRIGEFHFVADDVESSGGVDEENVVWNGLTIYKALDADTTENTMLYWDDSGLRVWDEDAEEYLPHPEAFSVLPAGVTSGSMADANNDGRADGFHTWGNFTSDTVGDGNLIDTYVYGASDTKYISMGVAPVDGTDDDGISSSIEFKALNNGDGNGDGIPDHQQDNVTSLPNGVINGAYNTLEIEGCDSLSDVAIYAESELGSTDDTYEYPVGLFNFDINCLAPGDTATVTVFYDKVYDTSAWKARKFINDAYSDIAGATFDTATVGGTQVTTLTYTITDGGPLDEDGTANSTIVDPAGPGATLGATVGAPNTGLQHISPVISLIAMGMGVVLLAAAVRYAHKK